MKTKLRYLLLALLLILYSNCYQCKNKNANTTIHETDSISFFLNDRTTIHENDSILFFLNDEIINAWEITTTDSINHLLNYFYQELGSKHRLTDKVGKHLNRLYNHGDRRIVYESLIHDSTYKKLLPFRKIVIIEKGNEDHLWSSFSVILSNQNEDVILRLKYQGEFKYRTVDQTIINHIELETFLKQLNYKDVRDTSETTGAFDCIVSVLKKDSIQIFPYFNNKFSGSLDKAYLNLFLKN